MIDLERIAHKLVVALYTDSQLTEIEKAQIEYGFSLTLGIGFTAILALAPAYFFGSLASTGLIMTAALAIRIFSGGGHCSSYGRCLFLSLSIFLPSGLLLKTLIANASCQLLKTFYLALVLLPVLYQLKKRPKMLILMAFIQAVALLPSLLKGGWQPEIPLPLAAGVFIQTAIATTGGEKIVENIDLLLKPKEKE